MEYIVNTFDKKTIYELSYKLKGEIVDENETLVLVTSDNEMELYEAVESILGNDNFKITERTDSDYQGDDDFTPENLINWSELSRLLSGNRSVVSKTRMPAKHKEKVRGLLDKIVEWHDELLNETKTEHST